MQNDEQNVIARAQKGDKTAISILYSEHIQAIRRYVRYRVDSDAVADDITADVFLRMVRELPRYKYTGIPFSAWLYRIASNRLTDMYRRQRYDQADELPEELSDGSDDPLDVMVRAESHEQLKNALQSMTEDYQDILILRFVNNLSHSEVAHIMNKSESATRVLQHRALKALATALQAIQQGGR